MIDLSELSKPGKQFTEFSFSPTSVEHQRQNDVKEPNNRNIISDNFTPTVNFNRVFNNYLLSYSNQIRNFNSLNYSKYLSSIFNPYSTFMKSEHKNIDEL